jgi:Uma2 family endonuclease
MDDLDHVLLIEPNAPEVMVWRRGEGRDWAGKTVRGLDGSIDLPLLGASLRLADIYEGLTFEARPRLLPDPDPDEG